MDQQVKQWIDYAAQDLGVARHLFENYHPKPLEIVCYHCQQSAEKAIKAVIVSLHWPTGIPKSHDLSFLLNQIHNYISIPDAIGDAADALTPFGTMTRYPNELTVEEHHAKHADRVCAEGAAHGDFLRGLVLRAGELQINAFHQVDIKAGCGFPCDLAHIRETGAELVDVRSDKRRWNEAGDLAV